MTVIQPNWISGSSDGPVGLPSGPMAWIEARMSVALGPAKRCMRVVPLVSPTASPITSAGFFWLVASLRLLGRSIALCSVTTVVRSGLSGKKAAAK